MEEQSGGANGAFRIRIDVCFVVWRRQAEAAYSSIGVGAVLLVAAGAALPCAGGVVAAGAGLGLGFWGAAAVAGALAAALDVGAGAEAVDAGAAAGAWVPWVDGGKKPCSTCCINAGIPACSATATAR